MTTVSDEDKKAFEFMYLDSIIGKSEEEFPKDAVGCLLANSQQTVGHLSADCQPTFGRWSADRLILVEYTLHGYFVLLTTEIPILSLYQLSSNRTKIWFYQTS